MLKQNDTQEIQEFLEAQKKFETLGRIDKYVYCMKTDKNLKDILCYNSLEERKWVRGQLPWEEKYQDRVWSDVDEDKLKAYIQSSEYGKLIKTNSKDYISACNIVFYSTSFNPVEEYLSSLKWDKVRRLENVLHNVFFVEKDGYKEELFSLWMKAAVGRALEPGIKFDRMMILISPQAYGKDLFLSKLCPNRAWYLENFKIEKDTKNNVEPLRGKWIANYSEMADFKKQSIEGIKSFLSTQTFTTRVAWGRESKDFPRKDVIVGTSNKKEIIQDSTGARRFDPIDLTHRYKNAWDISQNVVKTMTKDYVDMLWAEAVANFKEDNRLYLPPELEERAKEVQENLQIRDPWEDIVNIKVDNIKTEVKKSKEEHKRNKNISLKRNFFTVESDIYMELFAQEGNKGEMMRRCDTEVTQRIKNILNKRTDLEYKRVSLHGSKRWGYIFRDEAFDELNLPDSLDYQSIVGDDNPF